ncbi:hypothetical protein TIFTF001_042210 [Ficus carica]|uniref:Retrotransposon gag domain-containing protein n=1 Tax=Ficus carica TaxID=3494 RepID=A0AA88A0T7_FICCA|nr:hypothetical protein TIFTF001_042204 [Ficus carica]GMN35326.1 hypothetical protein TIFTF001_042206 [Ficus carica]GMN35335.1 hypothetical protein TIFTF001_042208 [Ficus carica]GMN35351.1 hypothetical protein TIFTF001_042210 [Ficus carica]
MKPPELEGSTDPLEAEEWLTSLQIVLNYMDLTEQEKVFCASYVMKKDAHYWWETVQMRRNVLEMTWNDFIKEFNEKFYNRMAMKAQQNEFNNNKQGTVSVIEAICKFDQLAQFCPHLMPTKDERVRRMLDMFHPEIAIVIDSGERPPTTIAESVERALCDVLLKLSKRGLSSLKKIRKRSRNQNRTEEINQIARETGPTLMAITLIRTTTSESEILIETTTRKTSPRRRTTLFTLHAPSVGRNIKVNANSAQILVTYVASMVTLPRIAITTSRIRLGRIS